jgi:aryl-alcohol dehydrogenase-like predicted oxidoreductase
MSLPETSYLQLTPDLRLCCIVHGLWQVSGAHGHINPVAALQRMADYHDAGFTTWDLADHYGPAEDFIGAFRRQLSEERGLEGADEVHAFTKWVPQRGRITRQDVVEAVNTSLRRMGMERLDLLQFHWWDYADAGYLDALGHLMDLRAAGKIRHLGLTNFDTERLAQILSHGIQVVSHQVQYSLLDRRPAQRMEAVCREHGVQLLAYGAVCGGLLSERFLDKPEPRPIDLDTASLRKYKPMVDAWGGWDLFQDLLQATKRVAERHGVRMATVAVRAILDRPLVAGVIVGTRLGVRDHLADTARVFDLQLTPADVAELDAIQSRAKDLLQVIGDVGDEYRNG